MECSTAKCCAATVASPYREILESPGRRCKSQRIDSEPSVAGASISISSGTRCRPAMAREGDACGAAEAIACCAHTCRSACGLGAIGGDNLASGKSLVRQRAAFDGIVAAAGQGRGFGALRADRSRREGRQGSSHGAAGVDPPSATDALAEITPSCRTAARSGCAGAYRCQRR